VQRRRAAIARLETHPPPAAIDQVTITIEPTPGRVLQHTLFTRPQPTPEELSTLIARLHALMGQDRVGSPAAVDTWRPGAFAMQPFAIDRSAIGHQPSAAGHAARSAASDPLVSALRRCRQPVAARVAVSVDRRPERVTTDRRGYAGGAVVSCAGPWHTSGAWWNAGVERQAGHQEPQGQAGQVRQARTIGDASRRYAADEGWEREEWDVAIADGAVYRIFRDCVRDAWFIDGVVD
jgi:protein ImuB